MTGKAKILFKGTIDDIIDGIVIRSSQFQNQGISLDEGSTYYLTQIELDQLPENSYEILEPIEQPNSGGGTSDDVTVVSSVLPTGAAKETTLSSMNNKIPSLGQTIKSSSIPVTLASDQSAVQIKTNAPYIVTNSVGVNANGAVLFNEDVRNYKNISLQIIGTFTATITVQGSNDGNTWVNLPVSSQNSVSSSSLVATITTSGLYQINVQCLYIKVIVTAYTSGTATAVLVATEFSSVPFNSTNTVIGTRAHSTLPADNPILVAGEGRVTQRTTTGDGLISRFVLDKYGRIVVKNGHIRELQDTSTMLILSTTNETTLIPAIATAINDITNIVITNTSATDVRVDFRDTTGGTVKLSVMVRASDTKMLPFSNSVLKQTAVNTNWTAQLSAAVTDVRITATSERVG
ncbi:hypothetical protein D3C76_230580 [compost metagenome]